MQLKPEATPSGANFDVELPQCCGTGCAVCVLDYPELSPTSQTAETLALLEAVEQAQAQASAMASDDDWM